MTCVMNLPNYFLADLPPEATLSPAMISEACQTLKRNREQYLAEPFHAKSGELFVRTCRKSGWKPEFPFRQMAMENAGAIGFSRATVGSAAWTIFSKQLTRENFHALLHQEFGDAKRLDEVCATRSEEKSSRAAIATAPEFHRSHLPPATFPNPALTSIIFGLLTRSAQFVKCASGGSFLPRLFAHSIYDADPKLGACLEIAEWRGGSMDLENALVCRGGLRHRDGQRRNAG